jgi:hypothetical protein
MAFLVCAYGAHGVHRRCERRLYRGIQGKERTMRGALPIGVTRRRRTLRLRAFNRLAGRFRKVASAISVMARPGCW